MSLISSSRRHLFETPTKYINSAIGSINDLIDIPIPTFDLDVTMSWLTSECRFNASPSVTFLGGTGAGFQIENVVWPTTSTAIDFIDEINEACEDAFITFADSFQVDNCCGAMRSMRGYPPEGAADGADCDSPYDCDSSMCVGGQCDSPIITYPAGFPCMFDHDCESGDCRQTYLAGSFCFAQEKKYKLLLYDYDVDNSGTDDQIDIYVVKDSDYSAHNSYQRKLSDTGVSYSGRPFDFGCMCNRPRETSVWSSPNWKCGDTAFHSGWPDAYSVILCNNGNDGFYIDRLEIKKNANTAISRSFGAPGGGGYCLSTQAGDDFSGKCSSGAFQCTQFKMNGSVIRGVTRPNNEEEGLCSY